MYIGWGLRRDVALSICGITRHQYYYEKSNGKGGVKPSTHTYQIDSQGSVVEVNNEKVIEDVVEIKSNPETDYRYRAMTAALMLRGYMINHKKVYRLMREYQLLHSRAPSKKRRYVKYRKVNPTRPLEILEMDIKFQWVSQHCRYAFILTIIDTFTRKTLAWTVAYSIRQDQVKQIWDEFITNFLQPAGLLAKNLLVQVRNDNDSRFVAKSVQQYFAQNHLDQVFTHPYTPQENGHIESFHAILSRSLARKEFATLAGLEKHLELFYASYNDIRVHGSLDHLPPTLFWNLWSRNLIQRTEKKFNRVVFRLKVPHYLLLGNGNLREVSSLPAKAGTLNRFYKEVDGAISLQQPLVQRQPSVVSS